MKSLLIIQSEIFKKIILSHKNENNIKLDKYFEYMSCEGLRLMISFYGFEKLEIRDDNCVDLFIASYYLQENIVKKQCLNYIKDHINSLILMSLLPNIKFFKDNNMNELMDIINRNLQTVGFTLFKDDLLLSLTPDVITLIIQLENIIVPTEFYLYVQTLAYILHFKNLGENMDELIKIFSFHIQWKSIPSDSIKLIFLELQPIYDCHILNNKDVVEILLYSSDANYFKDYFVIHKRHYFGIN